MLRIDGRAEGAIWSLVRSVLTDSNATQRRLGEAVMESMRLAYVDPGPVASLAATSSTPYRLAFQQATFDCVALGCSLSVGVCVARQLTTDRQRNRQQLSRGQGTAYPHCDTATCAQGRGIRQALEGEARASWLGRGPAGGRFLRSVRWLTRAPARGRCR